MDGSGNCIEIENGVTAIGSGGLYAHSAAMGMIDNDRFTAEEICHRAMKIAGDLCVYTNHETMIEVMNLKRLNAKEQNFKPTVVYWDERAKGAQIYNLLAYCGFDYNHEMLVRGPAPDYHKEDWVQKKPDVAPLLDFPNVPYLLDPDNGVNLSESKSIMKYIACQYDERLLGTNAYEVGTADMISRIHDEWYNQLSKHGKAGDQEGLQASIESISQQFANFLGAKKFAVGEKLTFIDFSLFEIVDYMNVYSQGKILEKHKNLRAYHERITRLPRFAEAWGDDTKLMKRPFKFYDRDVSNL